MDLKTRLQFQQWAAEDRPYTLPDGSVVGFRSVFNGLCKAKASNMANLVFSLVEPRAPPELRELPFLLRGFQNQYLDKIQSMMEGGEDALTEKTREMGATWLVCALLVWGWIWQPRFDALLGSIVVDLIDKQGDPDTLFAKLDYLIESIKISAPWLYPEGYKPEQPWRTYLKIKNPANQSTLIGRPMGPEFGRSGRYAVVFMDEISAAESAESAYAACSMTSYCRLLVFTPRGMNFAGQLANPKQGQERTITKITLHWMIDETKNRYEIESVSRPGTILYRGHGIPPPEQMSQFNPDAARPRYPWYEAAKKRLNNDPVKIAQELDVDYAQSVEGRMYPQIEQARMYPGVKDPRGLLPVLGYDPNLRLYCSMDYGLDDYTALIWWQFDPFTRRFRVIRSYRNRGKTIKWYIPFILGGNAMLGQSEGGYNEQEREMIEQHRVFSGRYTEIYGDPSGKIRNQVTATNVLDVLDGYDIHVVVNEKAKYNTVRQEATKALLPYCDFDVLNTGDLIQDLRESYFKNNNPVHGVESHYRTATEFFFVNQTDMTEGVLSDELAEKILTGREVYKGHTPTIWTPSGPAGNRSQQTAMDLFQHPRALARNGVYIPSQDDDSGANTREEGRIGRQSQAGRARSPYVVRDTIAALLNEREERLERARNQLREGSKHSGY